MGRSVQHDDVHKATKWRHRRRQRRYFRLGVDGNDCIIIFYRKRFFMFLSLTHYTHTHSLTLSLYLSFSLSLLRLCFSYPLSSEGLVLNVCQGRGKWETSPFECNNFELKKMPETKCTIFFCSKPSWFVKNMNEEKIIFAKDLKFSFQSLLFWRTHSIFRSNFL